MIHVVKVEEIKPFTVITGKAPEAPECHHLDDILYCKISLFYRRYYSIFLQLHTFNGNLITLYILLWQGKYSSQLEKLLIYLHPTRSSPFKI